MTTRKTDSPAGKRFPFYAVYGADAFLRRRALDEITHSVLGDDEDGMALAEFEGPTAQLADVLDECRTPSLLSPVRLVCVRDADEFVTKYRKELEKYAESPSPTGSLVLVCTKWNKGWRLYKAVEATGRNVSCDPPNRGALPGWLVNHAKTVHGCTLQRAAAQRLADLTGDDLGRLDMELAKVSTFVSPRKTIRPEDVEQLVGATRVETVFKITDALAQEDAKEALALWDQVLATDRDAPYRAIGGLAFGIRKLAEAKRLLRKGLSLFSVTKELRLFGPPDTIKRQLDRFSLRQWQDHLVKLLQIDMAAKSGLGTVRSAVEKLIVEMSTAPPPRRPTPTQP
ncbi:MAG: DNA polymerase III subunit delta [Planctomycetota bacterium]